MNRRAASCRVHAIGGGCGDRRRRERDQWPRADGHQQCEQERSRDAAAGLQLCHGDLTIDTTASLRPPPSLPRIARITPLALDPKPPPLSLLVHLTRTSPPPP